MEQVSDNLFVNENVPSIDILDRIFPSDQLNDGVISSPVITHNGRVGACNCERHPETIVVE